MRLIDADKLLENIEKRIKGAKSLAEVVDLTMIECITDVQQSVPAVPLDRIKEAIDQIGELESQSIGFYEEGHCLGTSEFVCVDDVLEILNKLIAEVEE